MVAQLVLFGRCAMRVGWAFPELRIPGQGPLVFLVGLALPRDLSTSGDLVSALAGGRADSRLLRTDHG